MSARYIYRLDDITPDMDWKKFFTYMDLFDKYNVKPLIGIVPDNRDPNLSIQEARRDFWSMMAAMQKDGIVDIAQHGYQHILKKTDSAKRKPEKKIVLSHKTEFIGDSYTNQYEKIKRGREILISNNIETDIFMAPAHSFDSLTLKACLDLGFTTITDGIGLFPFKAHGLFFVPQQLWRPRYMPFGIFTICLHTNIADENLYKAIKSHLAGKPQVITFSEARNFHPNLFTVVLNELFSMVFSLAYRSRARKRLA